MHSPLIALVLVASTSVMSPRDASPAAPPSGSGAGRDVAVAEAVTNGAISIEPGILDFGDLAIGETGEGVVVIRNLTDQPLRLERVMPSCGCTIASAPREPIAAGASIELPVSLRAGARQGIRLDKRITVVAAGQQPLQMRVRAQILEFIGLDPHRLTAQIDDPDAGRMTLTSLDATPFRILSAAPDILKAIPRDAATEHVVEVDWNRWIQTGRGVRLDLKIDHPRMGEVALLIQHPAKASGGRDVARRPRVAPLSRTGRQLMRAAELGEMALLDIALRNDADIHAVDPQSGRTALHLAAAGGHAEVVEVLANLGAEIDATDPNGRTPLALAAENGREEVVKLLLAFEADLQHVDGTGRTPLLLASAVGTFETVRLLVDAGADVNVADRSGTTPLLWSAGSGDARAVELLLSAGANADASDRITGDTAFLRAARRGRFDALRALFLHGNPETVLDLDRRNSLGLNALHLAAGSGDARCVTFLLEAGAARDATCRRGWTPLDHARHRTDEERDAVVAVLLRSDAPSRR